ncbi:hypothetical protein A2U01_0078050, partial [Trifolium medium]|nr:hypothetical protein [Trifolium medium]
GGAMKCVEIGRNTHGESTLLDEESWMERIDGERRKEKDGEMESDERIKDGWRELDGEGRMERVGWRVMERDRWGKTDVERMMERDRRRRIER